MSGARYSVKIYLVLFSIALVKECFNVAAWATERAPDLKEIMLQ